MSHITHSKYRNTSILFELLIRQIASDALNAKDKSEAVYIIKHSFGGTTELKRELDLYQTLISEKFKSEQRANHFVDAVIDARKRLSETKLRREKYNLIKDIKQQYDPTDFFRARLNNYKVFASIYKLFENIRLDEGLSPIELIDARYTLIEFITSSVKKDVSKDEVIESYNKEDRDIKLLTYKILVDSFNAKFGGKLTTLQKKLLREYTNSVTNSPALKNYLNSEIPKVKKRLQELLPNIDDKVTKIKVKEVVNVIDKLKEGKVVVDNQVVTLLRYYELINELEKRCSKGKKK